MPILGDNVYEKGEPIHITGEVIRERINLTNKIIISTYCATGNNELARLFTNKGNIYIAPGIK